MKTIKITTKKGYTAVIIDDAVTVSLKDGQYLIYDNVASGMPCEDQSGTELFELAYLGHLEQKSKNLQEAKDETERVERKRIADIQGKIELCDSPVELAQMFGWTIVERASHWNELYSGKARYACHITSRGDYEIMQMAIDMLDISGEWIELKHRAGEHHSTGSRVYDLDTYQTNLRSYFNGDKFFYRSQESDKEFYCEQIKEAAEDNDIDKVQELVKAFDEIEPGYYDCNGNLEMPESDLESKEITGYSYDVYTYQFGFEFEFKYVFNQVEEAEEE